MLRLIDITSSRRAARSVAIGIAGVVLAAGIGGIAWAVGDITKAKAYTVATTYHITDDPSDGVDGFTTVQLAKVGQVSLSSQCAAYPVPETPSAPYHVGMKALVADNNGAEPVAVAIGGPDGGYYWLQPGESEAFIIVGEVVNEATLDGKPLYPYGLSKVAPVAILSDKGGTTASGTFASSAHVGSDGTGYCDVSLQLRG